MSFDPDLMRDAVAAHGRVARVLIVTREGSAPRDAGTGMLVWEGGQSGTVGGGNLEYEATRRARAALSEGRDTLWKAALGPSLGQCCGGAVSLLIEVWDEARLKGESGPVRTSPLPGTTGEMPAEVKRRMTGELPPVEIVGGWLIEPVGLSRSPLWIWGAGHVGRAVVSVLAPLDRYAITWVDTGPSRFPGTIPAGVRALPAPNIGDAAGIAPREARHLILTYSHELDLELCHRILTRGFAACGLIGSATKWVRFRKRLAALGHAEADILRIDCPIGDPALGKHPQAIAVGVAAALLKEGAPVPRQEEEVQ